ncbi:S1C family serine protease [Paenibacillus brevis]|uniref:Trypsin-like peptidase domain-containing protein n=1 Tax=Paenibacillus brevis TaxID=2841508 RepID=A0ABS6FS88_9BACL|nr:trypsin-like peptidase domain-containing protein [Paenibacillus brevis]MBU5671970.1 trypsin-like peptidase domain-containing protein [Paenibacillus brevis]
MNDEKYKSGQPFGDDSQHNDVNEQAEPQKESQSSYYYSYGPFQSYGSEKRENPLDSILEQQREAEDVEITRPQPVRPIPSMQEEVRRTDGLGSFGSQGGGSSSTPPAKHSGNWQFNAKAPKKTSFKSIAASVLAGMLIMTGGMIYADRTNLFTGDQASVPASAVQSTAQSAGSGSSSSSQATQASYAITNPGDVTNVVNQAGPAVVKIETLVSSSKQSSSTSPYGSNDPFYRFFFGDDYYGGSQDNGSGSQGNGSGSQGGSSDQLVPTGIGSGFIFENTGYILTNEHVVHNADVVQVTVQGTEKPYEAKVLGTSYELDLAVLKIEGESNFPSIPLANSDDASVGEWLVAIGNPQGFDHTVTTGVLSAKERSITISGENGEKDREYEHLLQTDASINPGNSGGPLLNLNGEVVGINVAVSSDSQGIGFAIPTSTISEVLDKLKNNEEIPQKPVPFIGATLMTMTDEVARQMGTDVKEGSVVSDIVYKSPAYLADLRPYDIITGADGKSFATKESLIEYIQSQEVGTEVTFNIVRDDRKLDLKITIGNKNDFNLE